MTMRGNDVAGTAVVSLVSSVMGVSGYLMEGTFWEALAIAASCGLVGGVTKGLGGWLWQRIIARYKEEKKP